MTEIPDDIMAKAAELAAEISGEVWHSDFDYGIETDNVAYIIARAILAERERCAGIATAQEQCFERLVGETERYPLDTSHNSFKGAYACAGHIASAIRGHDNTAEMERLSPGYAQRREDLKTRDAQG